jgi:hypothetical protein
MTRDELRGLLLGVPPGKELMHPKGGPRHAALYIRSIGGTSFYVGAESGAWPEPSYEPLYHTKAEVATDVEKALDVYEALGGFDPIV